MSCGLYYKSMTIINDDSRVVNKLKASLTDKARVVVYDRHMFKVQAIGYQVVTLTGFNKHTRLLRYGVNYSRKKFYDTGPWVHCFVFCNFPECNSFLELITYNDLTALRHSAQ